MNACMVLFMQSGFALLEAGSVRAKNVTNILIKNLLDVVVGAIVYWACGFAFAYGKVKRSEHDYVASNIRIIHGGSFYGEFFFNFVFAATATTIISGAVAERVEFLSYLVYGVVATGFIQPVAVHWGWSNGWLLYPPEVIRLPPAVWYRDYAGGGNVHAVGGIAALVGCVFMGPREGRFEDGRKYHIPGHSTPLTCMGAFILIIGFLAMVLGHGDNVALGVTNLTIGGSMSGITCMCIVFIAPKLEYLWKYKIKKIPRSRKIKPKQYWSFLVLVDATLAGMVAMCAGCNVLEPFGAAIIGIVAGFGFAVTEHWLHIRQIDDPVGSIPVHLTGGVIGVLMAPLFANKEEEYSFIHWKGCDFDCVGDVNSTCVYNLGFQGNVSTGRRPLHHGYKLGDCLYTPMNVYSCFFSHPLGNFNKCFGR
ncbi:unnamed protein product [Oikopleura dioica]|uniref:Ammonium transporter AmtB-like domain-containing protein n=1 Tax=Oikopleura dioica TaxID=34765 RepID=E4YZM0_OIKDI|nr:unnamed protein product [Oikopleura dioica]